VLPGAHRGGGGERGGERQPEEGGMRCHLSEGRRAAGGRGRGGGPEARTVPFGVALEESIAAYHSNHLVSRCRWVC
jgi:hypothetical protein